MARTCCHDGANASLAQLHDDGRRLRLERVFENDKAEELQPALHFVPATKRQIARHQKIKGS